MDQLSWTLKRHILFLFYDNLEPGQLPIQVRQLLESVMVCLKQVY